jgi:hypothetical protein
MVFAEPTHWSELTDEERAAGDLRRNTCEIHVEEGDFFYVRGSLDLPIRDWDESLCYGVWSSLSARNFRRFHELYDDPARVDEPPYSSWFGNRVPGFPDSLNLEARVEIRDADEIPAIVLYEEQDHPLVAAQQDGIELAQAIALVEPVLHT